MPNHAVQWFARNVPVSIPLARCNTCAGDALSSLHGACVARQAQWSTATMRAFLSRAKGAPLAH
eukprot:13000646-Alexandrium_andersonii.AAC.1